MLFKKSNKLFVHIDCDSFFAACEVFRNPELKGKKVCVGGEIIIASTYEAKALGVKTGTPIWEAKKILGNSGVFLGLDHEFYSLISSKLMSYLQENMLSVEQFSIDEAFCEITGLSEMYKLSTFDFLKNLQKDILEKVGIPVSIGCANTRIKAKIFSKLNKPFGIYIGYDKEQEFELFKKMPLKLIPFIGRAHQERLKYSAKTIFDYIHLGFWEIKKMFGKNGTDLWLELMGVNAFIVKKSPEAKSISRTRSFNKGITSDREFLLKQILYNFDKVFEMISDKNLEVKSISVMLRDKGFYTYYFTHKFSDFTNLRKDLLSVVLSLFANNFDNKKLYRSTGVVMSDFRSYLPRQINLFDKSNHSKDNDYKLTKIVNSINEKYGNHKVSFGVVSVGKKDEAKLYFRA
nr:DNA polymerase IV [Candidatus Gracilibacteria bacterium]